MNAIKNLKLTLKLVFAFLIVILIALAIGLVGINSMSTLSEEDEEMYLYNAKPMGMIAVMYDTLASQRICANNMVIFLTADPQFSQAESVSLKEKEDLFNTSFKEYKNYLSNSEEETLYRTIEKLYNNDFAKVKDDVRSAVTSGDTAAMATAIKNMDDLGSTISGYLDEAFALNDKLAFDKVEENKGLSVQRSVLLGVVMSVGVILAVLLAFFIASLVTKPLRRVLAATKQVGETGDLNFSNEMITAIQADSKYNDEFGQFALSFSIMMESLIEKTKTLEIVASGDLTPEVKLVSKKDTIGNALHMMLENLNNMFSKINESAEQVASGSMQIADGAQSLAQGSTEQASAVEQLSSSISAMTQKTKENAEMAGDAAELADTIKANAEKGSEQMSRMMQAVKEINEASQNISQVIKVIDSIAFQTNILALNAAVEAARAGQHGKGFAVVAEEVRNLAAKSASAAKNTNSMIADSMEKAQLGARIADETAASLNDIVSGINRSSEIVSEIAKSSNMQSESIHQINMGIDQVAQVVQQNSATAEESAAASKEMSNLSEDLNSLISKFVLRDAAPKQAYDHRPSLPPAHRLPNPSNYTHDDGVGYGKY